LFKPPIITQNTKVFHQDKEFNAIFKTLRFALSRNMLERQKRSVKITLLRKTIILKKASLQPKR